MKEGEENVGSEQKSLPPELIERRLIKDIKDYDYSPFTKKRRKQKMKKKKKPDTS